MMRSRYDSCASSCLSTASSMRSVRSASPQRYRRSAPATGPGLILSRYRPSSSSSVAASSPYEYDMAAATSSESVAPWTSRNAELTGDGVASDGEAAASCRFSGRGGVSRFLADRRRESVDSGLTLESTAFHADFRRASDPVLNSCAAAAAGSETPSAGQRCHSVASAPGSAAAAQWHGGHRGGGGRSVASSRGCAASLMSSRSSIATNQSDDVVVDVKYRQPASTTPSVADQVVGDLIIPDEMRDFINRTYAGQTAPSSLNADSTVADPPVDSDQTPNTKPPPTLASCMFEGQSGRNTTLGSTAQTAAGTSSQLPRAIGDVQNGVAATLPSSDTRLRSFDHAAVGSSTSSYFRSPGVAYRHGDDVQVQVSQVSQSWQTESTGGPRIYGSVHRTLDLGAEDPAVRHRRNPHQMNWWTRMYGYHQQHHHAVTHSYRPNYALPTASAHPPRTAASFVPSQMSPSCNQVPLTKSVN